MAVDESDSQLPTVVMDVGSGYVRTGLAGKQEEPVVLPSVVGELGPKGVMTGSQGLDEVIVGDEALSKRAILRLSHPVECGMISNWEIWEDLTRGAIRAAFSSSSSHDEIPDTADLTLLAAESPVSSAAQRERMMQVIFEEFCVEGAYTLSSSSLALIHYGFTEGIVLDSGDGLTTSVPVIHGHSIPQHSASLNVNGKDLTSRLMILLSDDNIGTHFTTLEERELVNKIKEHSSMEVSEDSMGVDRASVKSEPTQFILPDGKVIQISQRTRLLCTESLFRFDLSIDKPDSDGIHELVWDSFGKSDEKHRSQLSSHVCLAGGNTCFKGFAQRLQNELNVLQKFKVHRSEQSRHAAWLGGSLFAGLSQFDELVVSKDEYVEVGPIVAHLKCF